MEYVSLHHHSTYSYQDGYGLPDEHVKRAAGLDMSAIALTEHGNVSSFVKLEQAAQKHGIKPIFGLEAYTASATMREDKNTKKWHLTLLAMNQTGYANLNRIVTRSWAEGFYQWPTVSGQMLIDHNEGIICLSGCADSKIACDLLGGKGRETGNERDAIRQIKAFKRIFGDRFYLEVQQFPELGRSVQINTWYAEQSRRLGVPLVASSDCHYPMPDDNEMQKILHAAGRNIGSVEAAEASWEYGIRLTLPVSDLAIRKRLRGTGLSKAEAEQAIANTAVIADRCNVVLPKMPSVRYPMKQDPTYHKGMDQMELIRNWLNDGWKYRGADTWSKADQKKARAEVNKELRIMADKKGFLDYHLAVSDMVRAVKANNLAVGPGRGSCAASYVCYFLRITEINPLKFPMMMFERYIDPNRDDLPDIDLDFDDERRYEVTEHMTMRYGEDRVGNIGTFTKYKGKNSMDDVGRVYGIPKFEIENAKSFLVERSSGDTRFGESIEDTVEMFPQVKALFDKYPAMDYTMRLEGNYKSFGVHAAGLVVGEEPLWNVVAAYEREVKGNRLSVMSVDKYDGEHLGLLKLDVLGLTTMGMIARAIEMIGMSIDDLYRVPEDDAKTIAAFRKADVTGIFQFEGRTTRMVCQEVAPNNFMELADINALSRPGPLHSGQTGEYIAIKHNRGVAESLHPIIDGLTSGTHGQIIYQEQILAICRQIGQFPWLHAATIRKIISQKKGEAAFNELYGKFVEGAATIDVGSAQADKIWKNMVTAGAYAFNVAHCISYAMLAFWQMWIKQHHPTAFYAAALQKSSDDDKLLGLMRDAQDERYGRHIPILGPSLDLSGDTWAADFTANTVRSGFLQIKGVGKKTAPDIVEWRDQAVAEFHAGQREEYPTWDDMIEISGIGKVTVDKIRTFAEADDPFGVGDLKTKYEEIIEFAHKYNKGKVDPSDRLPIPNTLGDQIPYEARRSAHVILAMVKNKNPQELFENHRSRTGEELDPATVKDPHLNEYMTLYLEDPSGLITVKVNRWKYPHYKEMLINLKTGSDFLLIKAHKKPFYGKTIHADEIWPFEP